MVNPAAPTTGTDVGRLACAPAPARTCEGATRWRKRPVEVEAVQFKGFGTYGPEFSAMTDWLANALRAGTIFPNVSILAVKTLEGTMLASRHDWIIRGVKGELYPCKPDIFEQTYEVAA